MAQAQKIYLGSETAEKMYLGEHPISSFLGKVGVVGDGLIHYFNSQQTIDGSYIYDMIGGVTGSYVQAVNYDATEKVLNFNSAINTPVLSFSGGTPIVGNPPSEHSVFIFTKTKDEGSVRTIEFMGQSGVPASDYSVNLEFTNDSGTNTFQLSNESVATIPAYSLGEVTLNEWHQVGYTFSGSVLNDVTMWLDENQEQITGSASNMRIDTQYWEMGSEGGVGPYSGSIGAVLVYNRKLTDKEVKHNYQILSASFAG